MPWVDVRPQNIFHFRRSTFWETIARTTHRPKLLRRWPDVFTRRFACTLRARRDGVNLLSGSRTVASKNPPRKAEPTPHSGKAEGGSNPALLLVVVVHGTPYSKNILNQAIRKLPAGRTHHFVVYKCAIRFWLVISHFVPEIFSGLAA